MVVRFRVDVDTKLSAEKVLQGFTDFSENRTKLWSQLSKKLYKVHSVSKTSADVTEGSEVPISVWAREEYDFSKPGVVKWAVKKSNFSLPGYSMVVIVTPNKKGSHVRLNYERGVYGFKGLVAGIIMTIFGKTIITKYYQDTFNNWSNS
jgi:hypothetical protein